MNAIEIAMKMESDAIRHYREAMEKCSHPAGKRMFEVILEDEKHHYDDLKRIVDELDVDMARLSQVEDISGALDALHDAQRTDVACTLDELEVLKMAMDMEKEGYEFYRKQAEQAEDGKEKALFEKLAKEESEHYRVFSETHSFLSDSGNWFMWDEHSIVEG